MSSGAVCIYTNINCWIKMLEHSHLTMRGILVSIKFIRLTGWKNSKSVRVHAAQMEKKTLDRYTSQIKHQILNYLLVLTEIYVHFEVHIAHSLLSILLPWHRNGNNIPIHNMRRAVRVYQGYVCLPWVYYIHNERSVSGG